MLARITGLGGLAAALALLLVALRGTSGRAARRAERASATPERLLIVADEREPMDALAEFLRTRAGCDVTYVDKKALPKDLSPYAAVFMYIHGRMSEQVEKSLIDYTLSGGRMIVLHHGLASAKVRNGAWMRLCGMHIAPRNDPNCPWKVLGNTTHTLVNLQPRHYITAHDVLYDRMVEYRSSDSPSLPGKLPALDMKNTEIFLNQHFTDGRAKTVLFGFLADRGPGKEPIMQDRSGWYKPAGKGWLFYLQPGHAAGDFRNRSFCQILWNCLTWRPDMPLLERPARVKAAAEGRPIKSRNIRPKEPTR